MPVNLDVVGEIVCDASLSSTYTCKSVGERAWDSWLIRLCILTALGVVDSNRIGALTFCRLYGTITYALLCVMLGHVACFMTW
jgi:hypothetical protein